MRHDPVSKAIRAAVDAGRIVDVSYGNDVCPSYIAAASSADFNGDQGDSVRRLWVDHIDPRAREYGDGTPRLMICSGQGDDPIYIGEFDAEQAIDALIADVAHDSRSYGPRACAGCGDDIDDATPDASYCSGCRPAICVVCKVRPSAELSDACDACRFK